MRILILRLCSEVIGWKRYIININLKIAVIGFGKIGLLHSSVLNLLATGLVKAVVDRFFLIFGTSLFT